MTRCRRAAMLRHDDAEPAATLQPSGNLEKEETTPCSAPFRRGEDRALLCFLGGLGGSRIVGSYCILGGQAGGWDAAPAAGILF